MEKVILNNKLECPVVGIGTFIYLKRGYHEIDYIKIDTGHGDYLCADVMEKKVGNNG